MSTSSWHHDFYRDRPGEDENGNIRYPSRDFKLSTAGACAGFNKADLRRRGWTRTAIKRILGEPDSQTLVRRNFRKDRPECVYSKERVIEAEERGVIRYRASDRLHVDEDGCLRDRNGETVDLDIESPVSIAECPCCFDDFKVHSSARGRKRKYCSTICRNRAARKKQRLAMRNEPSDHN